MPNGLCPLPPSGEVREIDGAAHTVPFDAPGNFARVIAEAMRSSEVRSGTGVKITRRDGPGPD